MIKKPSRRVNAKGRSTSGDRFVRLPHYMIDGAAWRALSLAARCLLIEVWRRYNGSNNGEISYSVREAAKALGVGKNTASRAFHELEEKGFLKVHQRGSFDWKVAKATEWKLTAEPWGERPASKEFMRWHPKKQNPVPERGTVGPRERDREAHEEPSRSPYEGPSVPIRGTDAPIRGPSEGDTSTSPCKGGPFVDLVRKDREELSDVEYEHEEREAIMNEHNFVEGEDDKAAEIPF